ncbi:MAG: HAMP domain-containing histidine kinase [Ferrovibrio sp.]|uniref:sensor histidine kinase n=1 Tax=Ferrovibrio sp. TaxID=1917215 RepID=UPI0026205A07|nr:HAMP domain-containing sensor histidine kinase [Ferrovibrio sp.]MCW0232580.1 HAMP domain-containing histidine kinase [Ferrovibrio sp.]
MLLWQQLQDHWVLAWWLLHMLAVVIIVIDWYIRRQQGAAAAPRWQGPVDIMVAGFSGLVWGAGALGMPQIDTASQLLLVAVIAGVIGGSAPALALMPAAGAAFIVNVAWPYAVYFLTQGSVIGYGMAALIVGYVGAMIVANRVLHSIMVRNWRLSSENTALYDRIRKAQDELLDIADSSEAFVFFDHAGRMLLWSRRFPALLGLAESDLKRHGALQPLLERAGLPPDLTTSHDAVADDAGRPVLPMPNGGWARASLRDLPHGDRALFLVDVTEQQQASSQLQSQNTRLEELFREVSSARDAALRASQAKSTFLANMSHELRTPLNAVIGFSDIIRRKLFGSVSPKYDEYIDDVYNSGCHLLGIIDDILDLARIEANQIVVQESRVDLAEEIATSIRLASQQFGPASASITVAVPDDLPALHADARLVRQILINLVGNALKFSPGGLPVEVGARLEPASNEIQLWVRDYGIGIAKQDQARIFDPFEQAGAHLSRNFGGVGLGLSLVRAFVVAHQGRLAIDSEPGKGTLITASFPATRTVNMNDRGEDTSRFAPRRAQ